MTAAPGACPQRGEVYWLDFAPATGQEMTGMHLCVVVQNDVGNQHSCAYYRRGSHQQPACCDFAGGRACQGGGRRSEARECRPLRSRLHSGQEASGSIRGSIVRSPHDGSRSRWPSRSGCTRRRPWLRPSGGSRDVSKGDRRLYHLRRTGRLIQQRQGSGFRGWCEACHKRYRFLHAHRHDEVGTKKLFRDMMAQGRFAR